MYDGVVKPERQTLVEVLVELREQMLTGHWIRQTNTIILLARNVHPGVKCQYTHHVDVA